MKIQVFAKNVYGVEKIYPHCKQAKLFAKLAGQTTLTGREMLTIQELGYLIELVHPKSGTVLETFGLKNEASK